MTALMLSVFSASAALGLAWQTAHSRCRGRTTAFALGIMLVFVVVSSLPRDMRFEFDIEKFLPESGNVGEYYYVTRDAVEGAISHAVADEFGLSDGNISVGLINFDFENMHSDTVVVTLSGKAVTADYKEIEKFVNGLGIGRCRVDVEIG
jgi:hypothetical protein